MDYKDIPQRVLRIIMACAVVFIILFICVCVGVCSAIKISILNCVPFLRRRNVPEVEFVVSTSRDQPETSIKSMTPPSSECSSPQSILNSTENTAQEKAVNDPRESDQISPKENLNQLEGLALQMVHLERHRISADLPSKSQSCESFESPNKSSLVKKPALKGVLKASLTIPNRGTRRISFKESPEYDAPKHPSDRVTSGKRHQLKGSFRAEKRKVSSAPCLKKCAMLAVSPVKSSETETVITEQFPQTLEAENAPKIESGSNQQLVATEKDYVSGDEDSTVITSEFEKSPEVGHQYSVQDRVESTSKLKSGDESLLDKTVEELSTLLRESNLEELSFESAVEEERSYKKNKLNPNVLETSKEFHVSLESEDHLKMLCGESTVTADDKDVSQEIIAERFNKMDVEQSFTDSFENIDGTSSSDIEASLKTEEGKCSVGQASKTEDDDVLEESEVVSDQHSAEEHTYL